MKALQKHLSHTAVRGFTITEMAIAAVISLMATTAAMSVFISSSKMAVESLMRNRAYSEARLLTEHLASDIRAASSLVSNHKSYAASANTLILRLPSIDADGFPLDITTKFDTVIYHPDKTQESKVVRTVDSAPGSSRKSESRVIGRSANRAIAVKGNYEVLPDALGAHVIYYKFTARQNYGFKQFETPLAGSIRLRNRG